MTTDSAGLRRSFRLGHRVVFLWVPLPAPGVPLQCAVQWVPDVPQTLSRAERRLFRREYMAALHSCADEMLAAARTQRLLLTPDPIRDPDRGRPRLDPRDPRLDDDEDDGQTTLH